MFDFHEKRKIRGMLYSKPVIGLLLVAAGFLSISAYNRYEIAAQTKEKLEIRQAELDKLNQRAEVLQAKVQHLEDERGVEEELRSRFDVAREGEDVVIIIENEREATENASMPSSDAANTSFFARFKFW